MRKSGKFLSKLWIDESCISSVEYVMLLALIGSAIIAGAAFLGVEIGEELNDTAVCIDTDGANCT